MHSLRQMGYSFESAISDIVDNSISADGKIIEIDFPSNPTSIYISIVDNGCGMDSDELFQAMKYGSKNPLESRDNNDLGRFGLGLKLASLSLCKILTVVSKKNGQYFGMRWNLNNISDEDDWYIEELSDLEIECIHSIQKLHRNESGTLVLWEDFDFMYKISGGKLYNEITSRLADSIFHLSLVYHRFLSRPHEISILVNDKPIMPLDPFLSSNKKTRSLRSPEYISVTDENDIERKIRIEAIVLPFHQDLTSQDINDLGGIQRLSTMQGFYVYRNNRLIIWGTWFKMKPDSELTKYARIKVDIPSSLDSIWQIDIKKSNAQLPSKIRNVLSSYVEEVMNTSIKRSTHRTTLKNRDITHLWETHQNRDKKLVFKVNRKSAIFQNLSQNISESDMIFVEDFIEYLEKSLPYQDLYVEQANNNISIELDEYEMSKMISGSIQFSKNIARLSPSLEAKVIVEKVCNIEPFSKYTFVRKELEKYYGIS